MTPTSVRAFLLKTFPEVYKQDPTLLGPDSEVLYSFLMNLQGDDDES